MYFLAYAGFTADRPADDELAESYGRRLGTSLFLDAEQRYRAAVGIPQDAVAGLRVLTWMIHACTAGAEPAGGPARPNAWSSTATLLALWRAALTAAPRSSRV